VIALDTNILARAIVDEAEADAETDAQQRQARALLASGKALFVPVTVMEELEWVLRGVYDLPAQEVAALFEDLLAIDHITVDRAGAVRQAVDWHRQGVDFSDALHLAQAGLCAEMASFDVRFTKLGARFGLLPTVLSPFALT
jgi:predicted nucleic-acid-binding protein